MPLHENSREHATEFDYDLVEEAAASDKPSGLDRGDVLEFARRIVSYIRGQDRARLTVDCLYLALGDADLENATMSTVAAVHGITKAAVSKRVKKIRRELHLPVTANNKSVHASKSYARTNRSPLRLDKPASPVKQQPAPARSGVPSARNRATR